MKVYISKELLEKLNVKIQLSTFFNSLNVLITQVAVYEEGDNWNRHIGSIQYEGVKLVETLDNTFTINFKNCFEV